MITCGHPPQDAWDYTPVQAEAFINLAELRRRKERALDLSLHAMAQRGKADDINAKIRKDWDDE